MAITKRTRFEILRRDNHTCRYCGATAPDVKLAVNHVTPVALGGTDTADNLVAACVACNSGKASVAPDANLVDDVAADAIRWSLAARKAAETEGAAANLRNAYRRAFIAAWEDHDPRRAVLDDDWFASVTYWHAIGLPLDVLLEAVEIAWSRSTVHRTGKFPYMAGIAWNKARGLVETTKTLVSGAGHCDVCDGRGGDGDTCGAFTEPCTHCGEDKCLWNHGYSAGLPDGYEEAMWRASRTWQYSDDPYMELAAHVDRFARPWVDAQPSGWDHV